jgi:rhodanese-related sulfurtransferase
MAILELESSARSTYQQSPSILPAFNVLEKEEHSEPISVSPERAYGLVKAREAILIDIRTIEERRQGYPENSFHIPWRIGPALLRNPRFQKVLREITAPDTVTLLICRTGRRSLEAAQELRKIGFPYAYDVLEGFEGLEGAAGLSGWKAKGLPWTR